VFDCQYDDVLEPNRLYVVGGIDLLRLVTYSFIKSRYTYQVIDPCASTDNIYNSSAQVCIRLSVVSNAILYIYRTISGYQLVRRLGVDNSVSLASVYLSVTITYGTGI
jgi:hypothetical protein